MKKGSDQHLFDSGPCSGFRQHRPATAESWEDRGAVAVSKRMYPGCRCRGLPLGQISRIRFWAIPLSLRIFRLFFSLTPQRQVCILYSY